MAQLITKRYAKAFFDLAVEENQVDVFYEEFKFVINTMKKEKELYDLFIHPQILIQEKQEVVRNIFEKFINKRLMSFLHIIVNKRRENYIIEIFEEFERIVKKQKGIVTAYVEAAIPLNISQTEALKQKLEKKTNMTIEIKVSIKPELIGGISVRLGDLFIDGTILGKMKQLKETLKGVQLVKEGV